MIASALAYLPAQSARLACVAVLFMSYHSRRCAGVHERDPGRTGVGLRVHLKHHGRHIACLRHRKDGVLQS